MRLSVKPGARIVFIIFCVMVAVEVSVRVLGHRADFFALDPQIAGLRIPHPTRGFSYRPGFVRTIKSLAPGDYVIDVQINELGLRTSRPQDQGPFEQPLILVLGGAFTEAWGVAEDDAWPRLMEARLSSQVEGLQVVNAGVSVYGLDQIQDFSQDLLEVMSPGLVVLGLRVEAKEWLPDPMTVVGEADVRTSLAPRVRPVEGGYLLAPDERSRVARFESLTNRFWQSGGWILRGARHARDVLTMARRRLPLAAQGPIELKEDAAFKMLADRLEAFHEMLGQRGIPLMVVLLNSQSPLGGFPEREVVQNQLIEQLGLEVGFDVVNTLPALVDVAAGRPVHRFPGSFHWPPSTHEIVASLVADRVVESSLWE
jgi:hypothetical protein